MAWQGHRVSKAAGGGMLNGYATPKAKQEWAIGAEVRVGFLSLTVTGRTAEGWELKSAKGKRYAFRPHLGLSALD